MGRCVNGMLIGLCLGAAVGMMVVPQLDRKTQRNMRRTGQRLLNAAEDKYENMMCWMK